MHYFYLVVTLLFFSSLEVVTKPISGKVDPFFLTFFRFIVGGTFLILLASLSKRRIERIDFPKLALVGCLNGVISMTLLQLSVKYSNASTAATLVAMNPLFVGVFVQLLGKDKISKKKWLAMALGALGVIILSSANVAGDSTFGIICGILAAISFALYTVLMKDFSGKYGALLATAVSTFSAGVVYGLLLTVSGKLSLPRLTWFETLILLYVGIGVTGVAYVTFFKAIQRFGPVKTSVIFYLKPVVASLLALLLLYETMNVQKIVGTVIVVVSLFLK